VDSIRELEKEGTSESDLITNTWSPFALYLIYKSAVIVTETLHKGLDVELERSLQKLRTLRRFLKLMGRKWLAGGKCSAKQRTLDFGMIDDTVLI